MAACLLPDRRLFRLSRCRDRLVHAPELVRRPLRRPLLAFQESSGIPETLNQPARRCLALLNDVPPGQPQLFLAPASQRRSFQDGRRAVEQLAKRAPQLQAFIPMASAGLGGSGVLGSTG